MVEPTVKVKTLDNKIFEVDESVARMSKYIALKLDTPECDTEPIVIDDKQVTGGALELIFQWCSHHQKHPEVIHDDVDSDEDDDEEDKYGMQLVGHQFRWLRRFVWIPEWDKQFLNGMPQGDLFSVIIAANILKIKRLLNMACKTVAMMMRGKSPEDIRQMFNIPNDLEAPPEMRDNEGEIELLDAIARR